MSNRELRRSEEKRNRRLAAAPPKKLRPVATEHDLMDSENELLVWSTTLEGYKTIARYIHLNMQMAAIMQTSRVDEDLVRSWLGLGVTSVEQYASILNKVRSVNWKAASEFEVCCQSANRFKIGYTNDEYHEMWELIDDPEIDPFETVREIYRHTIGMRDLTDMHVKWLKGVQKQEKKNQKQSKKPDSVKEVPNQVQTSMSLEPITESVAASSELDKTNVSKPFLPDVELLWTEREWSTDESDLRLLDTSSKDRTVAEIARVTRRYASIKPVSIANGLEFYTKKDAIQKALAARLRYVPDHIKDWARVKRGKDRIALQELEDDENRRRIVFFIEGRDQVYRGINR